MIKIRVKPEQPPICHRCSRATVAKRASGAAIVHCSSFGMIMPNDVTECDAFMPYGTWPPVPWKHAAEPLIIDVRPDPGQAL